MSRKRVNIITLGCSKNLVDTERLMHMLENVGYKSVHEQPVKKNDIIIINTCGFIGDAKEESINTILEFLQLKAEGTVRNIYVMGCLSQRYMADLKTELPEVDGWYGKFSFENIVTDLAAREATSLPYERILTTPPHMAYIKIAEGCNRFCAYCAIPLITGRFKSRHKDEILEEVRILVAKGVKEFNIIAQDLSSYGIDTEGKMTLASLIDSMAQIPGVQWIRLHYAYPTQFPLDVLDVMARHDNVCKYLDIALQHSSDKVLNNMRRHITGYETRVLLKTIREKVPGIHLRTTMMTGFPGEGEKEFEELLNFVKEMKFERMGAFTYCEEDDTYAAKNLPDIIPQEVKQERLNRLMEIQEEISMSIQAEKIGKIFKVIVDREEEEFYVGRTEFDSPEVDPEVLIKKTMPLEIGEFYNVRIIEALPFELIAEIAR